jgi:hypothetical protein
VSSPSRNDLLAYKLACSLPAWQDNGGIFQARDQRRRRNPYVTHDEAERVELQLSHLASLPDMEALIAQGRTLTGRRALEERLRQELDSDALAGDVTLLWRYVTGENREAHEAPRARLYGWWRSLRRKISDGWLARKTAVVWMNVLIALPLAFVYLASRGDPQSPIHTSESSTLVLKGFAIWSLAFLPGWLYVRFLGQRAGALWNEYVQNLHRLGLDRPNFLPRPPESSEYFDEWFEAEGYRNSSTTNLYRQKFAAYYGSTVSGNGELRTNFAVTTETMFPVFMLTLILATGFTSILWNTDFADSATTVWDMVKFGFLGAYVFIAQSLIRRFFQSDLRPSAYASAIQRIVVVLITVIAVHQLVKPADRPNVEAVVAFVIGIFPVVAFQALYRATATALRTALPQLTPSYPLNQLDGLNIWYENRLVEEGIEDMENLATANLVDVILHTRVPVGRLVDWVDQAHLYLHLDRVERGRSERRRAREVPHTAPSNGNSAPATDAEAKPGFAGKAASSGSVVGQSRVSGSIEAGSRAGTRTRVALRQLGIRNATDLLKAFPPGQIDRRENDDGQARDFKVLNASGVDVDQIRTLVRVLDEDTGLASVWNWQTRGSLARAAHRQPRSVSRQIQLPSHEHS